MILRKLFVFALALALLLCLAPAALAEEGDFQANVEVATPPVGRGVIIFNAKDAVEAFPDEEPGPAVYPVIVSAGQVYYAAYEDTVYNNGGLVYNNGGLVYNNNGTVYNNDGVTYNNGGTVFANGGEVFSGLGQVVHNGGEVYDFSTTFMEPFSFRVVLDADIAPFATLSDLREEDGALWLDKDAACVVTPKEGYHLFSAAADASMLSQDENGVLQLEQSEELILRLRFQADPPKFDKAPGTYSQAHALELSAAEGAEIYYWLGDVPQELETANLYTAPILIEEGTVVTAVAVAEGAEISQPATASYAVLRVSVPNFADLKAGYEDIEAQPLLLRAIGSQDGTVESVSLSGDGAASFVLTGEGSVTVPAGTEDASSFLLAPADGLVPGEYTASVTFTFDSGSSITIPVSFTVTD